MTDRELMSMAKKASLNAYVPYSRFPVGAALECDDGSVFTGCNVENAALGSTICAEPFDKLAHFLMEKGEERCLDIHIQRQDIFEAMHRI